MRWISGLSLLRALAPRPRCGAAARRAIPSRSCPPFPRPRLCRCGSPAVGAGLALSAAGHRPAQALASLPPSVASVPPAVGRCRPLSLPHPRPALRPGQARPALPGPAALRPPEQDPAVAARPGRPCPALRRLRPASPPRSAAVCLASCALLSVPGTPRRWPVPRTRARPSLSRPRSRRRPGEGPPSPWQPAPGVACHGYEYAPQGHASHAPAPRRACHGCTAGRLPHAGGASRVQAVFFRSDLGVRTGKKLLLFLLGGFL